MTARFAAGFSALSERSKVNVQNIVRRKHQRRRKQKPARFVEGAAQAIESSSPQSVLSLWDRAEPSLLLHSKADYDEWLHNPKNFFLCSQLNTSHEYLDLSSLYKYTASLSKQWDKIRYRVLTIFFYTLNQLFLHTKVTNSVKDELVDSICSHPAIIDKKEAVRQNLTKWILAGRRYQVLCTSLESPGAIFLLPDIGDSM